MAGMSFQCFIKRDGLLAPRSSLWAGLSGFTRRCAGAGQPRWKSESRNRKSNRTRAAAPARNTTRVAAQ